MQPGTYGKLWSSSSESSALFNLPIEILDRVLYFLSPCLSDFALVNSDCRYLARPLQFRCITMGLFRDDMNTPPRRDHGALASLLDNTQHLTASLGFAMATYIRYLHLKGGNPGCDTIQDENGEYVVFSVSEDLVSLIPTLVNLETLSHGIYDNHALRLTAPYMLALIKSTVKNVALQGVLFPDDEMEMLRSEGHLSWRLESLAIQSHCWLSNLVPTVLIRMCAETL